MLWHEKGGSGDRLVLLLHGLGATAAVWTGVRRVLDERGPGRWLAPDLSGHGASESQPHYSVGGLAADPVPLIATEPEVYVLGHSLGVYVGLALASGWFGVKIRGVVGLGPKISWSEADLQTARELAARPVRWYATSAEGWNRYRRLSGLDVVIAPADEWLQRGIVHGEQGWRLSQDPRTFGVAGAPFATLVASAQTRLILARGEHDQMVSTAELRRYSEEACDIATAGHNAHVEQPEEIVGLVERLLQR